MLHVLSSGSKGNCYCIETADELIFLDIGVSGLALTNYFRTYGLNLDSKQISLLITHEHTDHVNGLPAFLKKFNPEVYASKGTLAELSKFGVKGNVLTDYQYLEADNFAVRAMPVSHDAAEAMGFIVSTESGNTAIMTDLGHITAKHMELLQYADNLIIESNHDKEMLVNGKYHPRLKRRVASARGHLSNDDAMQALAMLSETNLKKAFLAHISEENNDYALLDKFATFTKNTFKIDTNVLRQKTEYRWSLSPFSVK